MPSCLGSCSNVDCECCGGKSWGPDLVAHPSNRAKRIAEREKEERETVSPPEPYDDTNGCGYSWDTFIEKTRQRLDEGSWPEKKRERKFSQHPKETFKFNKDKDTMKITSVTYRRLVSMGPGTYETEACEATAEVEELELPETVLENLKGWVNEQLCIEPNLTDEEIQRMQRKIDRAKRTGRGL